MGHSDGSSTVRTVVVRVGTHVSLLRARGSGRFLTHRTCLPTARAGAMKCTRLAWRTHLITPMPLRMSCCTQDEEDERHVSKDGLLGLLPTSLFKASVAPRES